MIEYHPEQVKTCQEINVLKLSIENSAPEAQDAAVLITPPQRLVPFKIVPIWCGLLVVLSDWISLEPTAISATMTSIVALHQQKPIPSRPAGGSAVSLSSFTARRPLISGFSDSINSRNIKPNPILEFQAVRPPRPPQIKDWVFTRKGIEEQKQRSGWPWVSVADLHDDEAMLILCEWYAAHGLLPGGERGQQIVFETAENAISAATSNPPGLFVRRLRDWKRQSLYPIAEGVCDRARLRLKRALGWIGPRREREDEWY